MKYSLKLFRGNREIAEFATDSEDICFKKYFDFVSYVADTDICGNYNIQLYNTVEKRYERDLDIVVYD